MYSDEERRMHVAAWNQSGMSQTNYAQMHGMSAKTLSNWCRDRRNQQSVESKENGVLNVQYSESDRQEYVRQWKTSGMNAAAYADMVGVNRNTFHTWLRKYGLRSSEVIMDPQRSSKHQLTGLTAVPTQAINELSEIAPAGSQGIRVTTSQGLQMEINTVEMVPIATELLRQLGALPCG